MYSCRMGYKGLAPPGPLSLSHSTLRSPYHMPQNLDRTSTAAERKRRGKDLLQWKHYSPFPPLSPSNGAECGLLRQETEGGGGLQLLTDKFRPHPRLCIIPSDVMFSMFQRHYVIKTSIKTAVRYSPVETEKANIEICHGNIPHQEQVVTIRIGRPHLKHKPRCLPSPARSTQSG